MSRVVMPSVTLAAVPSFTALVSRQPHLATLLGFVLGMGDYFLLRALGVTMRLGSHDATLVICVIFALNFAGLGWAIGRLFAAQAAVRASAAQVADSQRRAAQIPGGLVEEVGLGHRLVALDDAAHFFRRVLRLIHRARGRVDARAHVRHR